MDSANLGAKIRYLRTKEGLTLDQLAKILGIKKNMLSNYELGKNVVSIELLKKIADYFDISLDYLTQRRQNVLSESKEDLIIDVPVYTELYSSNLTEDRNPNFFLYTISLPRHNLLNGEYFGLIISDNSLEQKGCPKGTIAIAKKQSVAKPGDLIVYTYGEQSARYGTYTLSDENIIISPSSSDASITPTIFKSNDKEFIIIGKIVMQYGQILK